MLSLFSSGRTALAAAAFLVAGAVQAAPVVWAITGPGTTSALQAGVTATLSYNHSPASTGTWQVRGTAVEAGDYSFDWNYSGFHAFFRVTAFLGSTDGDTLVNAGPESCCTEPSAGFNYSGSYTFTGLTAGEVFGFNLGGSHSDSDRRLIGSLLLTQTSMVSAPGTLALAGLALLALGASTRRKS
ncbi:MAG: hypothetical protein Q8R98_08110 [Rubrivivax sp.]|nr:hypothetical protein [Rubrivivax sp.]MDP3611800.1 hypothetical protein [Rubrivivax sp.]